MSKKDGLPANRALTRSEHAVAPRDTELLEGCFSPKVIKALRNYEKSFEEQAQESEEPEEPAPAYFSLETLKYAQFLVQSNVKLGDWIEFCCKLEFHTHWDGVYRTLGHPLSQTLGQSVTAPSELSFGAFLLEERRTTAYGQRRLFHGSPGRSPY